MDAAAVRAAVLPHISLRSRLSGSALRACGDTFIDYVLTTRYTVQLCTCCHQQCCTPWDFDVAYCNIISIGRGNKRISKGAVNEGGNHNVSARSGWGQEGKMCRMRSSKTRSRYPFPFRTPAAGTDGASIGSNCIRRRPVDRMLARRCLTAAAEQHGLCLQLRTRAQPPTLSSIPDTSSTEPPPAPPVVKSRIPLRFEELAPNSTLKVGLGVGAKKSAARGAIIALKFPPSHGSPGPRGRARSGSTTHFFRDVGGSKGPGGPPRVRPGSQAPPSADTP